MTAEARREAGEWYGALVVAKDEIANLKAEVIRLQGRVPDRVAASARVIGLHLDEFCDKHTEGTYYDMIAEAARRARTEIERLRSAGKGDAEKLAAHCHDVQWSGWMRHMFSKGTYNLADDTITLPKWAVERWTRQMNTAYADLPEAEKKSDREAAKAILRVLER